MPNENNFNRFTKEAREALLYAEQEAKQTGANYVGTEHILLGIINEKKAVGAQILEKFGISMNNVRMILDGATRAKSAPKPMSGGRPLSRYAKKAVDEAVAVALRFGHKFVSTEHLLYGLMSQKQTAAVVILENMKVEATQILTALDEMFTQNNIPSQNINPTMRMNGNGTPFDVFIQGLQGVMSGQQNQDFSDGFKHKGQDDDEPKSKTPALDYFTIDMTAEARDGKLETIIGREKEIDRMISILNRKTKNNPLLIGEPGVGKTAVVEGLALRIAEGNVPTQMANKRLLMLDMASVVAGTKYRGEFEDRMKKIITEITEVDTEVILFVDEMHTIIGAGSAEGSLDAANIMKPALSRGKIQVIGATTIDEFRKQIEKEKALERRFQQVMVDEPSMKEAVEILNGLKKGFEEHHKLFIDDEALASAVTLSKRYVPDRYLPDKAIDLLDEAASLQSIKIKNDNSELKSLQKKYNKIFKKREEAVFRQDYESAIKLKEEEEEIEKKLDEMKTEKIPDALKSHITTEHIAGVVAKMTGIPVTKLTSNDTKKLKKLKEILSKRVVGQAEAVEEVSKAIRRGRIGISSEKRPIASFMFLGPTGVGKTEMVRVLADAVYDDPDALIKIDSSEFMERHNVSRLIGATAGYVGYEEGGQLTEAVRRRPYSIVLFDEIEKAHPDFQNMLLQVFEDGYLTDAQGRKVDFTNTIIILTSNVGANKLTEKAGKIGFDISEEELTVAEKDYNVMQEMVLKDLKDHFKPEFLNRLDHTVVFRPLDRNSIKKICKLQIADLERRLEKKGVKVKISTKALSALADKSYSPEFGARPARRAVRANLEDLITEAMLEGEIADNSVVNFDVEEDEIIIKPAKNEKKSK